MKIVTMYVENVSLSTQEHREFITESSMSKGWFCFMILLSSEGCKNLVKFVAFFKWPFLLCYPIMQQNEKEMSNDTSHMSLLNHPFIRPHPLNRV
jgi:hypothetical protein